MTNQERITSHNDKIDEAIEKANALPDADSLAPMLQEKSVAPTTSAQTVTPDSGYDGLSKVNVEAVTTATQATPSITVSSAGLITASATQAAGYVAAGTKSATKQLTTQAAQTITPSTSNKTIASGRYLTGTQTIKGDANLVAGNIKSGVSIFGVTGTMSASEDLDSVLDTQEADLNELLTILDGKAAGGGGASIETCTVTIMSVPPIAQTGYVKVSDNGGFEGAAETYNMVSSCTVQAVLNTIVAVTYFGSSTEIVNNGCVMLYKTQTPSFNTAVFHATDTVATISISGE